jgi:competence protein ComEC
MCCARPLLAAALAAGIGAALGNTAGAASGSFRDITIAPVLLGAIVCGVVLWLRASRRSFADIILALSTICVLFFVAGHQRQLPPQGDISRLVRGIVVPEGPQQRRALQLSGVVDAAPRTGDFGQEFPFSTDTGHVWVRTGREAKVQQGDALMMQAELADLPRIGNAGERQNTARLVAARCWAQARVQPKDLRVAQRAPVSFSAQLAMWRLQLQERYADSFRAQNRPYPHANAQLLSAMVFGDRGGEPLPPTLRESFRSAGLSHLLVASGTQVALLCALALGALRLIGVRGSWLMLGIVPILIFYALLTGGAASIWRATVAGGCVALAVSLGRPVDRVSLLALAFLALISLDVAQIHDIGFQLTFAATWGLAVLAPALRRGLDWLFFPNRLNEFFAATLGAQLATLPFLLFHFGRATPHAFAANALALPLTALLVGGGLLGLVFPPFNAVNYLLVNGVRGVAETVAAWPGAGAQSIPVSFNSVLVLAVLVSLMALFSTMNFDWLSDARVIWRDETRRLRPALRRNGIALIIIVLICGGIGVWRSAFVARDDTVRVALLDVGQGESIVITRGGRTVVIDCGTSSDEGRGDVGANVLVPFLQSRGVKRVDALVVTHADADHCNGIKALLREIPVTRVIDGAANRPAWTLAESPDYLALREEIARRRIPTQAASAGQTLSLGDAQLHFLAPLTPPLQGENNNAAVVMLEHHDVRMLLTADIEAAAEERLARREDVRCDLLKLAHHGSKTSSGELFLRAASPRTAMLSCGRYNSFGHPSPDVLARLAARGVKVFRTDRDGAVTAISDGRRIRIETFR